MSVFMDIANDGRGGDELTGVKTAMPNVVAMLHDVKDGRMVMTDKISVPAGSVTSLRPGAHHIMLLNMPKELKEGDIITLYLTFAKSGQQQVMVKVVPKREVGHARRM